MSGSPFRPASGGLPGGGVDRQRPEDGPEVPRADAELLLPHETAVSQHEVCHEVQERGGDEAPVGPGDGP